MIQIKQNTLYGYLLIAGYLVYINHKEKQWIYTW